MLSTKKHIEKKQAKAIKTMLQNKYDCDNSNIMEIANKQIIQLEGTKETDYYNIEKDVAELLTNISTPFNYKVTYNSINTTIVAIKALA